MALFSLFGRVLRGFRIRRGLKTRRGGPPTAAIIALLVLRGFDSREGVNEGEDEMANGTVTLYLTDKTGTRFWETHCGLGYSSGEEHNLKRHLAYIKSGNPAYAKCKIDAETARFVYEGEAVDLSADAIAAWLTASV